MRHLDSSQPQNSPLRMLQRLGLVNRLREPAFDRLVRLAARLVRAPLAWVSLIDADGLFLKSNTGLPEELLSAHECSIASSFCQHIITTDKLLVVEDAYTHALGLAALATAADRMAYVGIPLRFHSVVFGTLCVADTSPRAWPEEDVQALQELVVAQMAEFDLRSNILLVQEREQQQRFVTDHVGDVVFQTDSNGAWTLLNPAWTALTGFAYHDSIHTPLLDFIYPADQQRAARCVRDLLTQVEDACSAELRFLTHDGDVRWMEFRAQALRTDGLVSGLIGTLTDFTTHKLYEAFQVQSEERFRQLAENIREVFYLISIDAWQFIYVSPAYDDVWGRSRELLYEQPDSFLEGVHPNDRTRVRALMQHYLPDESDVRTEYRVQRPDGTLRWIRDRHFPIRNEAGRVYRFAGIAEDVTLQKQAEDERDRFFTVSSDMLAIWGSDGYLKRINPAWEQTLGFSAAELLAEPLRSFIHPGDQLATQAAVAKLLSHEASEITFECRYRCKHGAYKWIQWRATTYTDREVLCYAIGRDITEQRRAAHEHALLLRKLAERSQELSIANADLARAARLKDEFLASMSHELRTPLNAILGFSELLQEQTTYGDLNGRQLKALSNIEESGRHLLALINDILDLSKAEAGKLTLNIDSMHIEAVCKASLQLIRQAAQAKQLRLSFAFDSRVPIIQGDQRRLKQILVNLLSNAVKFTPERGAIGLEVVADAEAQVVRLTIWDTGIGIAPENQPFLFRPFVQLDSRLARQYGGTGLGLALVSRMVELHNGAITVASQVGQGSRFTVTLPWTMHAPTHIVDM